jgi:RNA polymerase sigma factor (TIGR02999 family)
MGGQTRHTGFTWTFKVSTSAQDEVTRLLSAASAGSQTALDRLLPIVYDEMRRLAQRLLGRERCDHTLQPTALVHEAYLKLVRQDSVGFDDRAQFFAAAATVMRRILVDHARAKRREKRGGDAVQVALDDAVALFEQRSGDLCALDEALTALAELDERKARLVELRFFAGVGMEEAARMLGVSLRTAERDWEYVRAWLNDRVQDNEHG